ncbi:6-phosphogluconolactonase [Corynebacterium yudongzhengii]|uniref:6-phosphogluconolactonase n=1 Tax=Corynebacterium yudongzhengii TaxID=2080740 RepID=A0A2U1T8D9_9CORY|nr:6-phosphogluconolactonase [Corynebacterium yudongzhengii]AWB81856.1 6-phosphogluconolactonase [Corynebacterium yudongzhengii]PWC02249.1 6-phosphogluconolactonase [Corynebacterium yudongzhengii]
MVSVARCTDTADLTTRVAERFVSVVSDLQAAGRTPRVVLTGGGAGIETLRKIASLAERIDWENIHVFFGDERNVPVSHPESNEGQAREALLDGVGIPEKRIHGYHLGELGMEEAVATYRQLLAEHAPEGFDIHLLGMGPEGHINTLFPDTDAVRERDELVVAEYHSPKPPAERVTLTLPAVNSAERVWLLVSGAAKAEAAGHILRESDPVGWPAAGARGRQETVLYVTEDAAAEL